MAASEAVAGSWGVGRAGRVLVVRVRPGEDLVPTLIARCREAGLHSGVIVSCIGSLKQAALMTVRPDADPSTGKAYTDPVHLPGPLEFIAGQGYVSLHEDSAPVFVHFHALVSDSTGRHISGHFLDSGNIALFTLEVAVLETEGIEIHRRVDETKVKQLYIESGVK